MIKRVFLRFGPSASAEPLVIEPEAMTVFVGPNNSGKTLTLQEIKRSLEEGPTENRKIVTDIGVRPLSPSQVDNLISTRAIPPEYANPLSPGQKRVMRQVPASDHSQILVSDWNLLVQVFERMRREQHEQSADCWRSVGGYACSHFFSLFTVSLDGQTRLSLAKELPASDALGPARNHLAALVADDARRHLVRKLVHEAIGLHFVIDATNLGKLRVRLSQRAPSDTTEEQAFDIRAREFQAQATPLDEMGDGVKAFVGIVCSLVCSDYKVMLIDEPDAFLHPVLARRLGREMARLATKRDGNVFSATHSAPFLMGCVESGKPTSVVRLTYTGDVATARVLSSEAIRKLLTDPLLRSTSMLEALFYDSAVICEGNRDRAFYSEINNRLRDQDDRKHVRDSIFLNAENKQTIRRIISPLREMGIPAAAVVDFDIIKGEALKHLLSCCYVPSGVLQSLGQLRGAVRSHFESKGLDPKRGGSQQLSGSQLADCRCLLAQLQKYGIFVVPVGEVEGWLASLAVNSAKEFWLQRVFERMGSDPAGMDYLHPQEGDVWAFIENIARWVEDARRFGMPT